MSEVKNLYQKLVEVRKSVTYIQKNTDGYKFKYASEGQILAAIREKMDEQNVFLEMEMVSMEPVDCHFIADKQQRTMPGLKCTFEFLWTNADNPSEQIKKKVILQDSESIVKTCGGLMTYANKYFLYKFFSVPTDKLDPDAFENTVEKTLGEEVEKQSEVKLVNPDQIKILNELCVELPNTVPFILKKYEIPTLEFLSQKDFDHVIKVFETARKRRNEANGQK